MSYKFSFADNEVYSATDVNNITQRLVTAGIADSFSDGVAYNVSRFNEAGKLLYTSGVVSEDCNTLKVTKVSDTEILINPGYAFFNDGAVIEIEEGGESLSFIQGSKNYVYLKNELADENRCYPCVSINEPTGDFVLLAEIDENGEITDKRVYAKGKLAGYQSVSGNIMRIQDYIEVERYSPNTSGYGQYNGSKSFDIGNNNFECILVYVKHKEEKNSLTYTYPCLGIYDIVDDSYMGFSCYRDNKSSSDGKTHWYYSVGSMDEESLHILEHDKYSHEAEVRFILDNGKLTVTVESHTSNAIEDVEGYSIDLILF